MVSGQAVNIAVAAGVAATITPPNTNGDAYCFLRIESSAGYDGTINLPRRPRGSALAAVNGFYRKEADGTLASAAIVPGASAKLDFMVDMSGQDLLPTISGRTNGTVSFYWNVISSGGGDS